MEEVNKIVDAIDQHLRFPLAEQFEKQTKVPKAYAALAAGAVLLVLVFFNVWGNLLVTLAGFVYPCYASFRALESKSTDDDKQWLTYWTVFAALNVVEFGADMVLYLVPFWYSLKLVLVVWLMLPQTKGALVVYEKILRPYLLANESAIDKGIEQLRKKTSEILKAD